MRHCCVSARPRFPFVVSLFLLLSPIALARPLEDEGKEALARIEEEKVVEDTFLDRQRTFVTNQFVDLSDALDRLISRKDSGEENNSYLVLDLDSIFSEGGEREFKARIRAKADLPNTKSRYKLIFESDPEDDFSPQGNELSGQVGSENIASDRAIAGVEYTKTRAKYKWQPSIDVGARFQFPIDLFTRLRFTKLTALPRAWRMETRIDLPYYAQEGAKPSARVSVIRDLSKSVSFKSVSRYKHTRKLDLHESYQSFQLNHFLSEGRGMEYKVGGFRTSEGEEGREYFIQLAYKQRVYRDWMYLVFVPQVSYPEVDDWHPNYAFVMQIEAIYSK